MSDIEEAVAAIAARQVAPVAEAVAGLSARIAALEAAQAPPVVSPPPDDPNPPPAGGEDPAPSPSPPTEPDPPEDTPEEVDPPLPPAEPASPGAVVVDVFNINGAAEGAIVSAFFEFERGELPAGAAWFLETEDGRPVEFQAQPHAEYANGDRRMLRGAIAVPPGSGGVDRLQVRRKLRSAPAEAQPALYVAAALAGRSVAVEIISTAGSATFDMLPLSANGWLDGHLAVTLRSTIPLPADLMGATSARCITDITVMRDSTLAVVARVQNDLFGQPGGGVTLPFSMRILIDGQVMRTIPMDDLRQYSGRPFSARRRADGGDLPVIAPHRVLDADRLYRCGYGHAVDRSQAAAFAAACEPQMKRFYLDRLPTQADSTTELWGYSYDVGQVGGRPEIGFYPLPTALFLINGDPRAYDWMMRCAKAASDRAFLLHVPETGRWLDLDSHPRFSGHISFPTPVGTDPALYRGFPAGQPLVPTGPLDRDDIGSETTHMHLGSHFAIPLLASVDQCWMDYLAAQATFCVAVHSQRYNGENNTPDRPHYNTKPIDYTTGVGVGPAINGWVGVRGYAWALREMIWASDLLPADYPNRSYYDRIVQAWTAPMVHAEARLREEQGELAFLPYANSGLWIGYMGQYIRFVLLAGGGSDREGRDTLRRFANLTCEAWVRGFHDPAFPWQVLGAGSGCFVFEPDSQGKSSFFHPPVKTWARAAQFLTVTPLWETVTDFSDWSQIRNEGDYQRGAKTALGLVSRTAWIYPETRRLAQDALVRLNSVRTSRVNAKPATRPETYAGAWGTPNVAVAALGMSYRFDVAPVIRGGQVFRASAAGVPMAAPEWDGSIPRMSAPGANDAFGLDLVPEAGELGLTEGGAPVWITLPPPGAYTASMWAASWDDLLIPRDPKDPPPVEHRGPAVTIHLQVDPA